MDTNVELLGSRKMVEPATEVDPLAGWKQFGTIGFEKYLNFLLNGEDAGVELEMVA